MKTSRLITGLIATALAATPLAMAAPAQATDNLTTVTTLSTLQDPLVTHGDTISIRGAVQASDGTTAYKGTVTLYEQTTKSPAATAIATVASGGYIAFPDVSPKSNASYYAVFSGYTATSSYEDNYAASTSVPIAVGVQRKLKVSDKGVTVKGRITPDFGKSKIKITISKKENGKYKKFRTIRTNKKGQFRIKLPARRGGLYFRFLIPGNKHYTTTGFGYRTWRY